MKNQKINLREILTDLLNSQKLGVLATQSRRQPYTSLVAIATSDDLTQIVFATAKATRKYANILADKKVSMLIDNSANNTTDFRKATAATVIGKIRNLRKAPTSKLLKLYLKRHPHLKSFIASPTTVFLSIEVEKYIVVQRFQNVMELHLKK